MIVKKYKNHVVQYLVALFFTVVLAACASMDGLILAEQIKRDLLKTGRASLHINFEVDSADISAQSAAQILEMSKAIKALALRPGNYVMVAGHTDGSGARQYNQNLSVQRARNVFIALSEKHGVPSSMLRYEGKGFSQPIVDPEQSAQDKARNRRVELILVK